VNYIPQLLLIGAVAVVGILHIMVPDHWAPITLLARGAASLITLQRAARSAERLDGAERLERSTLRVIELPRSAAFL
jgi:hypothetical protein